MKGMHPSCHTYEAYKPTSLQSPGANKIYEAYSQRAYTAYTAYETYEILLFCGVFYTVVVPAFPPIINTNNTNNSLCLHLLYAQYTTIK